MKKVLMSVCASVIASAVPPAAAQVNPLRAIEDSLVLIQTQVAKIAQKVDALPAPGPTTKLLFPFVSNQGGFDTTLWISNASAQLSPPGATGTCTVRFIGTVGGSTVDLPPYVTAPLTATGGWIQFSLSSGGGGIQAVPSFQGFARVDCNFPGARGFGILSDLYMQKLATTIPAEVLP